MPRIKQNLVLTFASTLKAFLRLDAGIGRRIPGSPEEQLKGLTQQVQVMRQRLRKQKGRLKQKTTSEAKLSRQLEREKQRTMRALKERPVSKKSPEFIDSSEFREQTHALPDPDDTIDRYQIFRSMISPLKPGKMLDVGTGAGTFAMIAARRGWEVTAVDARTVRMPDPEQKDAKQAALIKSIKWIKSDIREFQVQHGEHDLICIIGFLHHLEIEDQIKLLMSCSETLTILACRIAPEIVVTEGPYEGFYYQEPGKSREERDKVPIASWGNPVSFRHTEESLIRLLRDCGYGKVMAMRPPHEPNYTFYLALPVSQQ